MLKAARREGGSFELARLYITCCVADSIPLTAKVEPVVPVPSFGRDDWVRVTGTLARDDGELVVRRSACAESRARSHPYLTYAARARGSSAG